ncbi:hypothetical protein QMA56_06205 [Leuconostoc falkenbergense]|uniref:hypothetical protein n=1 Tax=Leuconostoc falkenbergense TaxID=2766470 RepID=UPI0024ADB4C2|nr:hypothetical protein [Leuconostoc falkenbergense]MDI6667300.1 hypothetical protein [Leuconostoc falkenbergense]
MADKPREYAKKHKRTFLVGTSGAGKNEAATTLSEILGRDLSIIDVEIFCEEFLGYNGSK